MFLNHPTQTIVNKRKRKCDECKKIRNIYENRQTCQMCYNITTLVKPKSSGNKVIDDFITHTQRNYIRSDGKLEFVPHDRFKDIEFIAEGGFSKIYKATWVDGPINWHGIERENWSFFRLKYNNTVVLKNLNNSKNITPKELNELKLFYRIFSNRKINASYVSTYLGLTQDPITKDIMIIMPYYNRGDLIRFLSNNFYNLDWNYKLLKLSTILLGLQSIHSAHIIHRDLHSGNIFFDNIFIYVGDLGISKSATESTDSIENYGIIPYMAPEIFQGQKYTEASDIYSFGMIMWEFMTGRRPFWNRVHDAELIIEICDGLRPPIVTNAPEGYIELMKDCWNSDPNKRPEATDIYNRINRINGYNCEIKKSSEIGPVTTNNPGAIYKSRPLSDMIQSAMSTRSLRSQFITAEVVTILYSTIICYYLLALFHVIKEAMHLLMAKV
ncbi:polo kinase CDC5 [Rhizophagus irregularis DAOM 197198w]|uniref:Polo kinase CDC5 n=1 Tax=Rhizophagus irregularis (strain DAOM 197198w) TaxID=1432141 RepID=A0A015KNI2_RHIIW|nr:polo kinase CDC5 [Rhizophagus irregularis DAOM 197198w]